MWPSCLHVCFLLTSEFLLLSGFGTAQEETSSFPVREQKLNEGNHDHDHTHHHLCNHGHSDGGKGAKAAASVKNRVLTRRKKLNVGNFNALGKTWASQGDFIRSGGACRYHSPSAEEKKRVRANLSKYRAQRQKLMSQQSSSGRALQGGESDAVINVDTYFHVVYNSNGVGNISDSLIERQIKVLNDGFKGKDTPTCFYSGNSYPKAKVTPFNFILKGITRHQNSNWFRFTDSQEYQMKQNIRATTGTPLECNQLHIYSTSGDGYLGWAYFPPEVCGGRLSTIYDGVVISWETIPGARGTWEYGEGATLTHEVGHWLGLQHTFEGGCSDGDSGGSGNLGSIFDTPAEARPAYGCPRRQSCSSSVQGGVFDPVDNFMDYSNDCCMFRFTPDQTEAMIDIAGYYRKLEPESAASSQSMSPSASPSVYFHPSSSPSSKPTTATEAPSKTPTSTATEAPSKKPTGATDAPSKKPTVSATDAPSKAPTVSLVASAVPSSSPETPAGWRVITYDDFEDGYGNFLDGGSDCSRVTWPSSYIHQGVFAVQLRDNSQSSDVYHRDDHNVSSFTQLRISFWLKMRNLENDRTMDFWLRLDSTRWFQVKELGPGQAISDVVDGGDNVNYFKNGVFYKVSTIIELDSLSFPREARLYLRSRGRTNDNQIFIDEVLFEGR